MSTANFRPSCLFALLTALASLVGGPALAQEARVRTVDVMAMPTQVDCNSPAFWRNGRLNWFGSIGRIVLNEADNLFGPWTTGGIEFFALQNCPHWIEAVWQADDGTLYGWYHCEPIGLIEGSILTAPKIGAVVSFDGGKTLYDLGVVLESGDPLDPGAQNGYFAGGHGDFSVILDRERKYFYFFFDNYGGPVERQGVAVARMAFADLIDPVGKVRKFHHGAWDEPGLGGLVTPIFPAKRAWGLKDPDAFWGPSLHWNTHLNGYVMLLNHAMGEPGWSQEGVYVSFAADLARPDIWKAPAKILDRAEFPGWYFFYPQVMGLEAGGTDTLAGQTARLYVFGYSKWEIDFSIEAPAPGPTLVPGPAKPIGPGNPGGGHTWDSTR